MGCWNGTCGVSGLPIRAGEKIRVFILQYQNNEQIEGGGSCYSNHLWTPYGPAIEGTYDDYGGIEKDFERYRRE
jgi:hypothetical protein